MSEFKWYHWCDGLSRELQAEAKRSLLKDGEGSDVLRLFFEAYGMIRHHHLRIGTVADYVAEMPPEPEVYVCKEAAEDAVRILDLVQSAEPPSIPDTDLPAVADACIERAMAYLELARAINAGELRFPEALDPPRTGPV